MLKMFSVKNFGAITISASLLLGALAVSPVSSAFAKSSYPAPKDTTNYQNNTVDADHDEMSESSEFQLLPYIIVYPKQVSLNGWKRLDK